jgi:hypothetical protein
MQFAMPQPHGQAPPAATALPPLAPPRPIINIMGSNDWSELLLLDARPWMELEMLPSIAVSWALLPEPVLDVEVTPPVTSSRAEGSMLGSSSWWDMGLPLWGLTTLTAAGVPSVLPSVINRFTVAP